MSVEGPVPDRFQERIPCLLEKCSRLHKIYVYEGKPLEHSFELARQGAMVTGLDMMPHLLEEARAHAAAEGLRIRFDEEVPGGGPKGIAAQLR